MSLQCFVCSFCSISVQTHYRHLKTLYCKRNGWETDENILFLFFRCHFSTVYYFCCFVSIWLNHTKSKNLLNLHRCHFTRQVSLRRLRNIVRKLYRHKYEKLFTIIYTTVARVCAYNFTIAHISCTFYAYKISELIFVSMTDCTLTQLSRWRTDTEHTERDERNMI